MPFLYSCITLLCIIIICPHNLLFMLPVTFPTWRRRPPSCHPHHILSTAHTNCWFNIAWPLVTSRSLEAVHQQLHSDAILHLPDYTGGITVTAPIVLKPILYPALPILTAAMLFNLIHVILLKNIMPFSKYVHSKWPTLFNILLKSIVPPYTSVHTKWQMLS